MSFDLKIAYACPHYIRNERVALSQGRLVSPKSPISGEGLLEIKRDGVVLAQRGNLKEASLVAPQPSPYRVKDTTNQLSINVHGVGDYDFTLPKGTYKSLDLVSYFSTRLKEINLVQEANSVKFSDNSVGISYTLSGSFLQALGFKQKQVVVKSKQITPSWGLVPRLQGYDLIFSKTLTPEGLLEISYTTPKHSCRRCNSTGVENDLRWDEQGFIERVEGSNLLYQMVAKAVLTKVGSNPYHLKYGSNAFNLIGGKSNLGTATALRESVRQALTNLQRQQQLQKRLQTLSLEETLLQVEAINVSQIGDDATALVCNIIVRSASGTPVSVNLVFSVPGSTQINGELR